MTASQFSIARRDIVGSRARLAGAEHHHLSRVVRLRPGDEIGLFDETGRRYSARIERIGPEETELVLTSSSEPEAPRTRVTLGQAILKAKAMEAVVEKATELGVDAIAPLLCRRSVVRIEGAGEKQAERWRRIALAAAKQCRSGRVPRISGPVRMADYLAGKRDGEKLVLTERGGTPFREILAGPAAVRPDEAVLLVGPEGGWEPGEEASILAAGYRAVSLGAAILRAETAAVSAAAMVLHFWNA